MPSSGHEPYIRMVQAWKFPAAIFLFCGVFFGLSMALFEPPAGQTRLAHGFRQGLFFGAFMGVTLGGIHWAMGRHRFGAKAPTPRQCIELRISCCGSDAVRACEIAIRTLHVKAVSIKRGDSPEITARTKLTWKSLGEVVGARIESDGPGQSLVRFESRPRISTTLVDYGKGADNARQFIAALEGILAEPVVTEGPI